MERLASPDVSDQFATLIELEPKLIKLFIPDHVAEVRDTFLAGTIIAPDNTYSSLATLDFDTRIAQIEEATEAIVNNPKLNPKFVPAYQDYGRVFMQRTRLAELAHTRKQSTDPEVRSRTEREFMDLNIELYGVPDEQTYRSLLAEKLKSIDEKELSGVGLAIRQELFDMTQYTVGEAIDLRFKPSADTIAWAHELAMSLYGNLLAHVPDQATFDAIEIKSLYDTIIHEEFGAAAADWEVTIEEATALNVRASEKRIIVPTHKVNVPLETVRESVVHEIGVHMLRAVMGNETDLHPLLTGLSGYYDFEEGLGVVMEQALAGKFREMGVNHYINAGAVYFDNKDFRQLFEMRWRLNALLNATDNVEITNSDIELAKRLAYSGAQRIMRGTDSLPWFKDLAYYNGALNVWQHLEAIKGDDTRLLFLLLGKADPSNIQHQRILYETKSI